MYYLGSVMPPKRPISSPVTGKKPERQKKDMFPTEKVGLLDMVNEGKDCTVVVISSYYYCFLFISTTLLLYL